jgi:hypothetical protein
MDSQDQGTYDYLLQFPSSDLLPFDYLDFAERELDKNSAENRVNCVNHLSGPVSSRALTASWHSDARCYLCPLPENKTTQHLPPGQSLRR